MMSGVVPARRCSFTNKRAYSGYSRIVTLSQLKLIVGFDVYSERNFHTSSIPAMAFCLKNTAPGEVSLRAPAVTKSKVSCWVNKVNVRTLSIKDVIKTAFTFLIGLPDNTINGSPDNALILLSITLIDKISGTR